ncbi:hypothetical protein SCA6_018425 [Theobroma cacao]
MFLIKCEEDIARSLAEASAGLRAQGRSYYFWYSISFYAHSAEENWLAFKSLNFPLVLSIGIQMEPISLGVTKPLGLSHMKYPKTVGRKHGQIIKVEQSS